LEIPLDDWRVWLGAAVLVGGLGYGAAEALADRAEVDRLQGVADSAAAAADSAQAVVDSLAERSARLEADADSARAREEATRDSLGRRIADLRTEIEETELVLEEVSTEEDSAIARALQIVDRPAERAAVVAIARADSAEDTARDRLLAGMRAQVMLVRDSAASLGRENRQLTETLAGVTEERDSLRSLAGDLRGVIRAKDAVIAALEKPWWKDVLGSSLLEGAGTVGSGALSYLVAGEEGLLGWGIAKGADLVLAGR
ncbi:MAG: hypothetical protein ACOC9H_02840, partial [Gemmatimonadota bacterium]